MEFSKEWVTDYLPVILSLAAVASAMLAVFKSFSTDRPLLTAVMPFQRKDFPDCAEWWCLSFKNNGNYPAIITRTVANPELVLDPEQKKKKYPPPIVPEVNYDADSRGAAHALGPGQTSQRIGTGPLMKELAEFCDKDANYQLFLQCIVEYEDFFGRRFRMRSQFRYDSETTGFRLAWPSKLGKDPVDKAHLYFADEVLRGYPGTIVCKIRRWFR